MRIMFEHEGTRYAADSMAACSIAIPLDFDGPQPNHFGADRSVRNALKLGDFVGRTELGGSCNVDVVRIVPHCNGTHTETISHIVDEDIWVGHAAMDIVSPAIVVSVPVTHSANTKEEYRPQLTSSDQVVTAESLRTSLANQPCEMTTALILRTIPNGIEKCTRAYTSESAPAFLTVQAIRLINDLGCRHLLVDLPSIDRMYDDGLLTNHHLFWNVKEQTHSLGPESRQDKTISEMVYIPSDIEDGLYLLNLQVPAFCSDASPSRPLICPARRVEDSTLELK